MVPVFTAELEAQVLRGLDESDIDAATARSPAAVRVVWKNQSHGRVLSPRPCPSAFPAP